MTNSRGDLKGALHDSRTFPQIAKSVACGRGRGVETYAVVGDFDAQSVWDRGEMKSHPRSVGVTGDVMQDFFAEQVEFTSCLNIGFGRQRGGWNGTVQGDAAQEAFG